MSKRADAIRARRAAKAAALAAKAAKPARRPAERPAPPPQRQGRAKPAPKRPEPVQRPPARYAARKAIDGSVARPKAAPQEVKVRPPLAVFHRLTGMARFDQERFFCNCSDKTRELLQKTWKRGDQLAARRVPMDGLPCVVIMAAFAYANEIALVDDYEALVQRYSDNIGLVQHPDKFFSSTCAMLYLSHGERVPSSEGFAAIGIPKLWDQMIGG